MRKQLLAIFSMFGLAGSSASASAQVLKGTQETDKTTKESKIKGSKASQENKPALDAGSKDAIKLTKANTENSAGKTDAQIKMRKAGGEQQAHQDVVNEKIGTDKTTHKHVAGVKYEKQAAEGAAVKNDAANKKFTKQNTEGTAVKNDANIKLRKAGGEQSEMRKAGGEQNDAAIKLNKASATTAAGAGKGKMNKNAAENQAAHQDLQKKLDKATPK